MTHKLNVPTLCKISDLPPLVKGSSVIVLTFVALTAKARLVFKWYIEITTVGAKPLLLSWSTGFTTVRQVAPD